MVCVLVHLCRHIHSLPPCPRCIISYTICSCIHILPSLLKFANLSMVSCSFLSTCAVTPAVCHFVCVIPSCWDYAVFSVECQLFLCRHIHEFYLLNNLTCVVLFVMCRLIFILLLIIVHECVLMHHVSSLWPVCVIAPPPAPLLPPPSLSCMKSFSLNLSHPPGFSLNSLSLSFLLQLFCISAS